MSDYIIKVENLGKKYRIRHQQERQRYVALRDVIANRVKALGSSVLDKSRHLVSRNGNSNHRHRATDSPIQPSDSLLPAPSYQFSDPSSPASKLRHPTSEEFWALKDVSFEVKEGEVVGIIGRNGAGKSTLLKILSRITEPTEGCVRIRGRAASLLEVGTGFHPELTGRENIYVNGAILGMTRHEISAKFDEIVAFGEIERFLDTPVKRYSSGMYVRLAFAVAAYLEPDILIVDEVLAVGDMEFQKKCLGKMEDVTHLGRTILFVSHNMGVIKSLCSRAILLDAGRVSCEGNVDRVVDAYHAMVVGPAKPGTGLIADAPRVYGTSEARFRSVQLMDTSGTEITQLYFAQPFRIQLIFDVLTDIPDAVIEVGMATLDGTRVTYSSNLDGGRPPARFPASRYSVAVDMDVILMPRQYTIDLGIHHRDGRTIDWVERTLDFAVLNVPEAGSDYYPWPSHVRGFVRPITRWQGLKPAELSASALTAGD
jgi:lipopolysaccharide transport system ATP-binding protein